MLPIALEVQPLSRRRRNREETSPIIPFHFVFMACRVNESSKHSYILRQPVRMVWKDKCPTIISPHAPNFSVKFGLRTSVRTTPTAGLDVNIKIPLSGPRHLVDKMNSGSLFRAQIDVRAHLSGKSDVQRVRGANPERSGTVIIVGVYPSEPQWIFIVEYEFHFSLNKKTQSKIRTEKLRASVFDRLIDIIGPPQRRFAGQVVNRKSRIP